jgi:hypothetical protein
MLFGEIILLYFENRRKNLNTLCGKNAEFADVKGGCNHSVLGVNINPRFQRL